DKTASRCSSSTARGAGNDGTPRARSPPAGRRALGAPDRRTPRSARRRERREQAATRRSGPARLARRSGVRQIECPRRLRSLPVLARAPRLRGAADALQVGVDVALLHAVPLVAGLVVVEAPFALELVVDVVAGRAGIDEIAFAFDRGRRSDEADLVLGPIELE